MGNSEGSGTLISQAMHAQYTQAHAHTHTDLLASEHGGGLAVCGGEHGLVLLHKGEEILALVEG